MVSRSTESSLNAMTGCRWFSPLRAARAACYPELMTNPAPDGASAEPLVSFRQSEWEAYQRYVAGLEARNVLPLDSSTQNSLTASSVIPPRHTALYVIGWVLFILQMVTVLWICCLPLIGFFSGTNISTPRLWWLPGVALIALTVLVQFRFWAQRRPVAVLLSGIFGPTFAWVGAWAFALSFAPLS